MERELLENFPVLNGKRKEGAGLKMADALFDVYFLSFPSTPVWGRGLERRDDVEFEWGGKYSLNVKHSYFT